MSKLYAAALLALSSLCLSARADRLFNLSGVTFATAPGASTTVGSLTGSFATNDAITAVIAYNISASAAGNFAGFNYTLANSSVTSAVLPSQYFQIDSTGNVNELLLYFTNGLTSLGGTLNPNVSYEHEPSGGNRFATGAVVPGVIAVVGVTPEPSSFVLLGTGLLGMVAAVKRRLA